MMERREKEERETGDGEERGGQEGNARNNGGGQREVEESAREHGNERGEGLAAKTKRNAFRPPILINISSFEITPKKIGSPELVSKNPRAPLQSMLISRDREIDRIETNSPSVAQRRNLFSSRAKVG